jgi:hypothetical protein
MEERLGKVIQQFQNNGFQIEKMILTQRSVSLLILVGEKPNPRG